MTQRRCGAWDQRNVEKFFKATGSERERESGLLSAHLQSEADHAAEPMAERCWTPGLETIETDTAARPRSCWVGRPTLHFAGCARTEGQRGTGTPEIQLAGVFEAFVAALGAL